jgi:hypothetical protein
MPKGLDKSVQSVTFEVSRFGVYSEGKNDEYIAHFFPYFEIRPF